MIILDRDGTLVFDRGYLSDPEGLEFLPGAAEGLAALSAQGHRLIVISNQSGVGRGLFPLERVEAMNLRLLSMVRAVGAQLERIYYCPHAPDAGCECRKPGQRLMRQAAAELHFDPAAAVVIGDQWSDIEFGQRAGARTVLIEGLRPAPAGAPVPTYIARDLLQAATWLQTPR